MAEDWKARRAALTVSKNEIDEDLTILDQAIRDCQAGPEG